MFDKLIDNLTGTGGLARVRSLIALGLVGTFCFLAIDGTISAEIFVPIVTAVTGTYFGARIAGGS